MAVHTFSDVHGLAAIIASLPTDGVLPTRSIVIRSEAAAHVVRRALVERGAQSALLGTRFVDLRTLASQVLSRADVLYREGEERLRLARVRAVLRARRDLSYFRDVADINGWDVAFARTIDDLEAAALGPRDLESLEDQRAKDLGIVWRDVEAAAATSWTRSRILIEAAAALDDDTTRWPEGGTTLLVVDGHETHAEAAFVSRIPRARFAAAYGKPVRAAHIERVRMLFGEDIAAAISVPAPSTTTHESDERSLLVGHLFDPPALLGQPERPRSKGADGTVHLEELAGVSDEIDAAVAWVVREVIEKKTPLEQIAIVVPQVDPIAGLLVSRLSMLPWSDGEPPVHVIGGLPFTTTSAGARITALVRALRTHQHADALSNLLPSLRLNDENARLGRGAIVEVLSTLGTVGGSSSDPRGALEWSNNLERQRLELRRLTAIEHADESERDDHQRRVRRLETLDLIAVAMRDLGELSSTLIGDQPLPVIWQRLRGFIEARLPLPGEAGRVALSALDVAVEQATQTVGSPHDTGFDALDWLEDRLQSLRSRVGRFGEPRITIATLASASTLSFAAMRVIGLSEGVLPRSPRENPVLSDELRAQWPELRRARERTLQELQSFSRSVANTRQRVSLSYARKDLSGSYRELSPVFVEIAAALGRHGAGTSLFPDTRTLARHYFDPARHQRRHEVREVDRLRLASSGAMFKTWQEVESFDPLRIRQVRAQDVISGPFRSRDERIPGLTSARPTSASRLSTLLQCGHRFFVETVLGLRAPPERSDEGAIDTLVYGSLFHGTAEAFYRAHGASFMSHARSYEDYIALANTFIDQQFDELLGIYPLRGKAVRSAQRARLRRDVHALLEHDWESSDTMFVDVERPFGMPEPLVLDAGDGHLHLRGFIDRIDRSGGTTRIWDLKTGKAHPRKKGTIDVGFDIQIALYARVATRLAAEWGLPARVRAAYVYPSGQANKERAFDDDIDQLMESLDTWLSTAHAMLSTKTFPRTTEKDDCQFCSFKLVCGDDAAKKSAARLETLTDEASAAFFELKGNK